MNPFISFCLYVAARVFVQYLKSRPEDNQAGDSLRFLLSAMNVLKRKNPLTESFLIQLDVDLESLGLRKSSYKAVFAYDKNNVHTLPPYYSNVAANKSRSYLMMRVVSAQASPIQPTALSCRARTHRIAVPSFNKAPLHLAL